MLTLREAGERVVGGAEYATSLFTRQSVERYLGYYRRLLAEIVADENQTVERLAILSGSERRRVLEEWNETRDAYPEECIQELFEAQVGRTPDAVAVVFEEQELSYAELNRRANRLAHHLRELGVRPDTRVAVCVERGFELIVSVLGVLKAGGAYVPMDPSYPAERLSWMLEDCGPAAVLTQAYLSDRLYGMNPAVPLIEVDAGSQEWEEQGAGNLEVGSLGLSASHLAYVIYTSGSTGKPKGVMVTHAGVCNYLRWAKSAYEGERGGIVSSSFSFDGTVTTLYTPLLCGGRIRFVPEQKEMDGLERQLRSDNGYGLYKITPAYLDVLGQRLLAAGARSYAHQFVIGGERLAASTVGMWRRIQPDLRMINEYGPTETVVGCVVYEVPGEGEGENGASIPIGRPIANTRIYILDESGAGAGGGDGGAVHRWGGSGARILEAAGGDGGAVCAGPVQRRAGRADVPERGSWQMVGGRQDRVSRAQRRAGEGTGIPGRAGRDRSTAGRARGVREAVVVGREDTAGDQRLVAYYTTRQGQIGSEELRGHLRARIPEYMVPTAYVQVVEMPITANGKLDRSALPEPDQSQMAVCGYQAPEGETEQKLAQIWAEVLKVERVGRQDNFFSLGGHSLLAVTVATRLRQAFGVEVAIDDLFSYPILADLATASILRSSDVAAFDSRSNGPLKAANVCSAEACWSLIELNGGCQTRQLSANAPGSAECSGVYARRPLAAGILFTSLDRARKRPICGRPPL